MIMGPSGPGKSTMMNIVGRLDASTGASSSTSTLNEAKESAIEIFNILNLRHMPDVFEPDQA